MCPTTESKSRVIPASALPLAEREAIVRRFNQRVTAALLQSPPTKDFVRARCGERVPRDALSASSVCRSM